LEIPKELIGVTVMRVSGDLFSLLADSSLFLFQCIIELTPNKATSDQMICISLKANQNIEETLKTVKEINNIYVK
jgi:predicted lactoylglutathione lyase